MPLQCFGTIHSVYLHCLYQCSSTVEFGEALCFFFFFGEKPLLVPTFSGDSHFSPYILFFPLLVPILKNASRFGPCRYIKNGEN